MRYETEGVVQDQYHCRCHKVASHRIRNLEARLDGLGFGVQALEEDHGQAFGRRLRLSEHEQIHIKVMRDGWIEAEIEPPPEYPFAHMNQAHSYSAHKEVVDVLRTCGIQHRTVQDVPPTCLKPVVDRPDKPTSWKVAVLMAVGAVAGALVVWGVNKLRLRHGA